MNEIQTLSGVLATDNDANGLNIINLATPVSSTDASNKVYVDTAVSAASSVVGEIACIPFGNISLNATSCPTVPGYSKFVADAACCWRKDDSVDLKRIFVTSIGYDGNLGGEAGADAKCQTRADAANRGGTFKAWLLDGTGAQYIYNKFTDASYSNILGQKVITTFLDYNSGYTGFQTLESSINYDEFKRSSATNIYAWTNLDSNGYRYALSSNALSCYGFTYDNNSSTALVGNVSYLTSQWSSQTTQNCSSKLRLICVEI